MKEVTVVCPEKKPARVCDLVKEDSGIIYMKIKFPNTNELRINLSDYLKELGGQPS